MGLFEGKTTTERNKIIAAGVLGLVALIALYFAFGRSLFSSSPNVSVSVKSSPTPRSNVPAPSNAENSKMPTASEQDFAYQTTMVDYRPGSNYAPDPGRNIFAFFEPPPPCGTRNDPCPTPTPTPVKLTPTPTLAPTPVLLVTSLNPGAVYAGVKAFRIEVNGNYFTPDAHIYFNQSELPTTFVNAQRLFADVPANLVAQEGSRQIIIQTPDGRTYSNPMMLNVQAPPRPTFQYIGMIGRKRYNNDTAYFTENSTSPPFGARLNDVIRGQFRLIEITPSEVTFEDVNLGFKHRVLVSKAPTSPAGQPSFRPGFPADPGVNPMNGLPPGFPPNIQPYVPPAPAPKRSPGDKTDVDDNDGSGG